MAHRIICNVLGDKICVSTIEGTTSYWDARDFEPYDTSLVAATFPSVIPAIMGCQLPTVKI